MLKHFMKREDSLPTVTAITTMPIVLADGGLLMPEGLDRLRGIIFEIQKEVRAAIPKPEACTEAAVRKALKYLFDEWLCDVAADFTGKCTIVALALTLIERNLLNERPAFFVTAGRRGSGKTTTITMLIMAVLGVMPAASAWSSNEEERRKALLSYFIYGMPYLLWDNIKRGEQISCPHVERSCTSKFYIDRKLGVSEAVATSGSTIHIFTGNNIGPKGDLASRSLAIRLSVDRPDPENRKFKHSDPVGWTEAHRVEIIQALYTLLLGNPTLHEKRDAEMQTRFKMWWRLCGSAVEYAAHLNDAEIDFKTLFLQQDEDEEESMGLANALVNLKEQFQKSFVAKDVADWMNDQTQEAAAAVRDFLFPTLVSDQKVSVVLVGKKLQRYADNPVQDNKQILILRPKRQHRERGQEWDDL
jgi:hypothetical protein